MARQPAVVMREAVTSDGAQPAPRPVEQRLTGARLVGSEPYRSGQVGTVVELTRSARSAELAFAIPAEGHHVRLTVGPDGRLLGEQLTTPDHLIQRTFTYPSPAGLQPRGQPDR